MSTTPAGKGPHTDTVRRVVTGHTKDGKAVVWKDEEVGFTFVRTANNPTGPAARYAHLWTTDKFPWDNTDERDLSKKEDGAILSNKSGSVLRVVDLPPHRTGAFHRTISLDYGIVAKGDCFLVLDDNKEVPLREGDVCIQRGTIHGWRTTENWCRFYFILLTSEPLEFETKKFGDEGYTKVNS